MLSWTTHINSKTLRTPFLSCCAFICRYARHLLWWNPSLIYFCGVNRIDGWRMIGRTYIWVDEWKSKSHAFELIPINIPKETVPVILYSDSLRWINGKSLNFIVRLYIRKNDYIAFLFYCFIIISINHSLIIIYTYILDD